jgi:hypothetical protein
MKFWCRIVYCTVSNRGLHVYMPTLPENCAFFKPSGYQPVAIPTELPAHNIHGMNTKNNNKLKNYCMSLDYKHVNVVW